jgi:hypothetical protein
MVSPDLAWFRLGQFGFVSARVDVMRRHVILKLLSVSPRWRHPVRDLVDGIEVVGEILGFGVANLPIRGKTGILYKSQVRTVLCFILKLQQLAFLGPGALRSRKGQNVPWFRALEGRIGRKRSSHSSRQQQQQPSLEQLIMNLNVSLQPLDPMKYK